MVHIHNDASDNMPGEKPKKTEPNLKRIALTARLSLNAYDALTEIQRRYRRRTGRYKCLWEVLDEAVIAHAKQQGIDIGE